MAKRTVEERRLRIRERIEFLERSILQWHRWKLEAVRPAMVESADAQLAHLRSEWAKERAKYDRCRSELELPWYRKEVSRDAS